MGRRGNEAVLRRLGLSGRQRQVPETWLDQVRAAGLRRDAVYLVRPDGYVARADPDGRATAIASYLDARRLAP